MSELIPNIKFQVGKGPLHIIVDGYMERKGESVHRECDAYLSGFRIADLDESGNVIDGRMVAFEEEDAPQIANLIAMALWDIAKGMLGLPVDLEGYSVTIDSPNGIDLRISRGSAQVMVPREAITELGGKLAVIVGSTPYRPAGSFGCPS